MGTILIISVITGMSKVILVTEINEEMVYPFTKLIRSPSLAYWVIGILMMIISWFFWPSPAVALMGAVLLPVALRVKLPAIGAAMAMNLFGHGIALSGDFIIQGAPKLTADGAGIPVGDVISASIPLIIVMGVVTTTAAFLYLRRDLKEGTIPLESKLYQGENSDSKSENSQNHRVGSSKAVRRRVRNSDPCAVCCRPGSHVSAQTARRRCHRSGWRHFCFILILIAMFVHKAKAWKRLASNFIEGLKFVSKFSARLFP